MAKFVYRLQKVYELRERKVKEQEQVVYQAKEKVKQIETTIEEKKNEIRLLRQNMLSAPHTLMASHDDYIHLLNEHLDQLYIDLELAKQELAYQQKLLAQYRAELEALEKHKEKAREEWFEEEKRQEMKILNEVANQRFFRQKLEKEAEEAEEALLLAEMEEEEEAEEKRKSREITL